MNKIFKVILQVADVRVGLSQIGYDLDTLQATVSGLDGKIMSLEDKQRTIYVFSKEELHLDDQGMDLANVGVLYLLNVAQGKRVKMPKFLQDQVEHFGKSGGSLTCSESQSLKGLKEIAGPLTSINFSRSITDGTTQDGIDNLDDIPRTLTRY
ncbi:unnamed protein product [Ilex paraguariensis]|uniref:Ubiquitin-like domain-containing protein n=1 Tax=Ilex paraguariensis TaxID=185542 RepID=A0ABC8TVB1_9AQUA